MAQNIPYSINHSIPINPNNQLTKYLGSNDVNSTVISDSSEDKNSLNLKPIVNHEPEITEKRENLETMKIENPEPDEDADAPSTPVLIKEEGRSEDGISRSSSLRFEDEDEKEVRNDDELSRSSSLRFEDEDAREERIEDGLSRSVSLRFKDEDGTKGRVEDGLPRSVSLRFKDEDVKSGEDAHRLHRTVSWGVVSSVDEDFLHDESDLQIFSISKPEIYNVSSTKIEFKILLN